MNCLCQLPNGIFATEEQLEVLKKKENCKILVFSDSHGDQYIVRDIFEKFGASCDAAVFAGDGIYDLVRLMENSGISLPYSSTNSADFLRHTSTYNSSFPSFLSLSLSSASFQACSIL